jgi:hypothetical protein
MQLDARLIVAVDALEQLDAATLDLVAGAAAYTRPRRSALRVCVKREPFKRGVG